jgi:anti-sigma regulatory factor (Ser/Thr protein kinase)
MVVMSAKLPGTATDPADARRLVRTGLEDQADSEALDLLLVAVSEVVTNAVVHGGTDVRLSVAWDGGVAHVEVSDGSPSLPHAIAGPVDADRGRGLIVLQGITDGWEADVTAEGKVVRFDVPVPARARVGSSGRS